MKSMRGGEDMMGQNEGREGQVMREEQLAKRDTQVIIKSDKCHLDYL